MTKIVALIENTRISKEYYAKHGLCLYIETGNHLSVGCGITDPLHNAAHMAVAAGNDYLQHRKTSFLTASQSSRPQTPRPPIRPASWRAPICFISMRT